MARKRVILPHGAAEADMVSFESVNGFKSEYGLEEPDFAICLRGNAVAVGLETFRINSVVRGLPDPRLVAMVPYGTPVQVQTL
jgi:hypothetical protein